MVSLNKALLGPYFLGEEGSFWGGTLDSHEEDPYTPLGWYLVLVNNIGSYKALWKVHIVLKEYHTLQWIIHIANPNNAQQVQGEITQIYHVYICILWFVLYQEGTNLGAKKVIAFCGRYIWKH